MSEPRSAGPTEIDHPGLEDEISAAFDRIRAEPLGARPPGQGSREGRDRRASHANRDAFLVMEHERRKLAERLHERREISDRLHGERQRKARYGDLLLITNLIAVEYEHLSGRAGSGKSVPPLLEGHLPERDTPAGWAQPWGTGPLFELRSSLKTYLRRRDRVAGRISAQAREQVAGEAEKEMDRIYTSSRLQTITGRWKFEAGDAQLPAAEPEQPVQKPAPPKSKEREERRALRDRKRRELRERKQAKPKQRTKPQKAKQKAKPKPRKPAQGMATVKPAQAQQPKAKQTAPADPKRKQVGKAADRRTAPSSGRWRKPTLIRVAAVAAALLIGAGIAALFGGGGSSKSAGEISPARAAANYEPLKGLVRVPTRAEVAAHRRAVKRARELAQRRQEARAARLAAQQAAAAKARKHHSNPPTPVPASTTPPPAPVSTPSPPPTSQPTQAPSHPQTSTQTSSHSPAPAPAPAPSPAPAPAK